MSNATGSAGSRDAPMHKLRRLSGGGPYTWELQKGARELRVRVEGQLAFNNTNMIVQAAEDGFGLGFVMEDHVSEQLGNGSLSEYLRTGVQASLATIFITQAGGNRPQLSPSLSTLSGIALKAPIVTGYSSTERLTGAWPSTPPRLISNRSNPSRRLQCRRPIERLLATDGAACFPRTLKTMRLLRIIQAVGSQ